MAYTVAEITELIHYHLVLGETNDTNADRNLAQLAGPGLDLGHGPGSVA